MAAAALTTTCRLTALAVAVGAARVDATRDVLRGENHSESPASGLPRESQDGGAGRRAPRRPPTPVERLPRTIAIN